MHLLFPPLPESDDGNAADASGSGLVLLDRWCYIANLVNATTAEGTRSTGLCIQVTFRAARPPLVSHFCVHCPGLDFPNATPEVITTDADLVLLCVPVYPDTIGHGWDWEYFVYSLRARRLDLVPNPNHRCLTDSATVLVSDVLSESPVLHDVPLPVPARGNWNRLLMELDPYNFRDVTISRNRDSIKYIETESWSPRELNTALASSSYTEWVRNKSRKLRVFRDGWKATTWTMAIPVNFDSQPWEKENCWHRHSEIDAKDVTLQLDASNACPSNLLAMLRCSKTTEMLKELQMSCPIMGMDDDIVYLLSAIKPRHMDKFEVVLAIDVSKGVLRGLAELDAQKNFILTDYIFSSDICRHLRKVTGTVEA